MSYFTGNTKDSQINFDLVSASYNEIIYWNKGSGKKVKVHNLYKNNIWSFLYLDNPIYCFVLGMGDGTLRVIDAFSTKTKFECEKEHKDRIYCLETLDGPEGKVLSGSNDCTIKLWDIKLEKCIKTFKSHAEWINCITKINDSTFASAGQDKSIRLFDSRQQKFVKLVRNNSPVWSLCSLGYISPTVCSGDAKGNIKVWDFRKPLKKCIKTIKSNSIDVYSLCTKNRNEIISGSYDKKIKLWDLKKKKCMKTFLGHSDYVNILKMDFNERILFSGGKDRFLKVIDLETEEILHSLGDHSDCIVGIFPLKMGKNIKFELENCASVSTASVQSSVLLDDSDEDISFEQITKIIEKERKKEKLGIVDESSIAFAKKGTKKIEKKTEIVEKCDEDMEMKENKKQINKILIQMSEQINNVQEKISENKKKIRLLKKSNKDLGKAVRFVKKSMYELQKHLYVVGIKELV